VNKPFYVLALLATFALVAGVWLSQKDKQQLPTTQLLFDDLAAVANEIQSIEIKNAQGVLFSAQKLNGSWLATFDPDLPVYPVAQKKLADLVRALTTLKLVEAKTSKPENFNRLGLQDIQSEDSLARIVTLRTANQSWQVLVGNAVAISDGNYVRLPQNTQSWQTDKTINLPLDEFSWLKQPVLPYTSQDLAVISRIDTENWQIEKVGENEYVLLNMPQGKELIYGSVLNSVVSSLTSLDFEALVIGDDDFLGNLNGLTQLEVNTVSGQVFQVVVSQSDDKYFVHFEANDPTDYWHKWYYQVSQFSAQQLVKTMDDFLKEEPNNTKDSKAEPTSVDEGESPY
jgi:hypothetical protein